MENKEIKTELNITLAYLPEDGKNFEGELSSCALTTSENDLVQPHGSLFYDIFVQRFDNELLVRGYLESTMEVQCARSDHKFLKVISIEEFATSIEIQSGIISLNQLMREELLIEMPTGPICDNNDENYHCEVDSEYLTVDKPIESSVNETPAAEGDKQWSNNWDALDSVNQFPTKEENN